MSDMTPEKATELRRPFPRESIGKLPKGGAMLDYVGHAAVTDRLLAVDPHWGWDFAEIDPATSKPSLRYSFDPEKNLWIRLTVCGVTRIGVGDGPTVKEKIGDAIRNAAMRFGVALDLWAKEDLVEFARHAAAQQPESPAPAGMTPPLESAETGELASDNQVRALNIALKNAGHETDEARFAWLSAGCRREITSSKQLTKAEASRAIDALKRQDGGNQ